MTSHFASFANGGKHFANVSRTSMEPPSQPETALPTPRIARIPPPHAKSLLISMNPRAGLRARRGMVDQIAATLQQAGYQVELTTDLNELVDLAATLHANGDLRAAIAVGGDGTAAIVRTHVPLEVPLLVVPMGTENLLGRYLRLSTDPETILDVVRNGVVVELDLGRANGKQFLLMISAGFDAEVIRSLHEHRRGNISRATYILPILRTIRSYEFAPMRIYWGEASRPAIEPTLCQWLFGFNLPLYALMLPIAADADGTDGQLDVCTFEDGGLWSGVRYLWHVVRRVHQDLPDAGLRQTARFRLEPTGTRPIAYQLDGDFAGTLPVDVEVLPKQLKLLVASDTARRLGFRTPIAHLAE